MSSPVKLKWSRDYGEIFGFDQDGARYHQDGLYFDEDGFLIEGHSYNDPKAKAKAHARNERESEAVKDEDDEDDDEESEPHRPITAKERRNTERKPSPVADRVKGGKLDLKAWAIGTRKYPFPQVRDQIRKDHSFTATDKNSAILFLVEQGIVKERDLQSARK